MVQIKHNSAPVRHARAARTPTRAVRSATPDSKKRKSAPAKLMLKHSDIFDKILHILDNKDVELKKSKKVLDKRKIKDIKYKFLDHINYFNRVYNPVKKVYTIKSKSSSPVRSSKSPTKPRATKSKSPPKQSTRVHIRTRASRFTITDR
jgi:hypothetical protein